MSSSSTSKGAHFLIAIPSIANFLRPHFSFMGGNSTKATSGINGAGTQTQQDHGIADSAKIFFDDTKDSVRILRTLLLNWCSSRSPRLAISRVMTSSVFSPVAQETP
jgi:hypothetical protein